MKNLQPSDLNSLWSIASQARYLLCSVPCFHRAGPINSLLCQVLLFIALQKRSINSAVAVAMQRQQGMVKVEMRMRVLVRVEILSDSENTEQSDLLKEMLELKFE